MAYAVQQLTRQADGGMWSPTLTSGQTRAQVIQGLRNLGWTAEVPPLPRFGRMVMLCNPLPGATFRIVHA